MKVSVVLCTYAMDRYDDFAEAAESVLSQTYDDVQLVIVVDGTEAVYERAVADFGDRDDVILHCNEENRGLSNSRNTGVELADGDVVAFMDDDAVADPEWLETLVDTYERHDALAAGGKMTPEWVAGKPTFLPEEFYWLVGVTYRGFAEEETELRNTFSSNLSFRRDVFCELGGFSADLGLQGSSNLQGEEPELCARMAERYGRGVVYNPEANVSHKVFDYRTDPRWLVERAFWQGYSKRVMQTATPGSIGRESAFLSQLLGDFLPERVENLIRSPSREEAAQLVTLVGLTAAVGMGYGYAVVDRML